MELTGNWTIRPNKRQVGAEFTPTVRISGHADDSQCSTMEIIAASQNDGLILGNALLLISPFASQFKGSFNALSASIHGQNHVITKDLV